MTKAETDGMALLRPLLAGGDRRSIARSAEARAALDAEPRLLGALAALAGDTDWLVAMRAVDLLEKLAQASPSLVEPYKHLFLGPLADSDKWEVRLQIVRALPLFSWAPAERKRARAILTRDLDHPQTFVRAWAADSLSKLAPEAPELERALCQFEQSGSKALQTRAKKIRAARP
jgi:HEAT repeat protein